MFELFFADPERINGEMDRLRAVTPTRIQQFAERLFVMDNVAILSYEPEGAGPT
jgi:hypothetical protein